MIETRTIDRPGFLLYSNDRKLNPYTHMINSLQGPHKTALLFILMIGLAVNLHAGPKPSPTDGMLRAGTASADITPELPIWLSGYASREKPASGVGQRLHAKALALDDGKGGSIVIVTVDLLGLSKEIIDEVRAHVGGGLGKDPARILFNSSHTHTGPVIWPCLDVVYEFTSEDQRRLSAYRQQLTKSLIGIIDASISRMAPARMYFGRGEAGFAINRRGALNPNGPIDHEVPVIKVVDMTGELRAVLFGYACHNTTIVDEYHEISGDWAGFTQESLEKDHPGAIALFMTGCGGDQNPEPRGSLQHSKDHAAELSKAIDAVLNRPMQEVRGPIKAIRSELTLPFKPVEASTYQNDLAGDNIYKQRRAKLMIQAANKGWKVDSYSYPIQAVRFGKDLTILGLADEVVVDYSLMNKQRYKSENLFVAGYCSQVNCYIPNKRILKEGGYEADDSMIYYGFPGPFSDTVEDLIMDKIGVMMKALGVKN